MAFPEWTEEHNQLREMVKDFAVRELAPHRYDWDKAGGFPREVFKQMAELGLLGIRFPEAHGGLGLDWWYSVAFVEGLSWCRNAGLMMSVLVDTDMATPIIAEIGTEEQKQEFLAPVIAGEKIAALGVTEPGCGSDVAALRTTAVKDGSDYIINGQPILPMRRLQTSSPLLCGLGMRGLAVSPSFYSQPIRPDFLSVVN